MGSKVPEKKAKTTQIAEATSLNLGVSHKDFNFRSTWEVQIENFHIYNLKFSTIIGYNRGFIRSRSHVWSLSSYLEITGLYFCWTWNQLQFWSCLLVFVSQTYIKELYVQVFNQLALKNPKLISEDYGIYWTKCLFPLAFHRLQTFMQSIRLLISCESSLQCITIFIAPVKLISLFTLSEWKDKDLQELLKLLENLQPIYEKVKNVTRESLDIREDRILYKQYWTLGSMKAEALVQYCN